MVCVQNQVFRAFYDFEGLIMDVQSTVASHLTETSVSQVVMELFHLDSDTANLSLGVVTVVCALAGILGGGQK